MLDHFDLKMQVIMQVFNLDARYTHYENEILYLCFGHRVLSKPTFC